jgi:hypothetical protein
MALEESPLGLLEKVPTAYRDRRSGEFAMCREPSAGSFKGLCKVRQRRWLWRRDPSTTPG